MCVTDQGLASLSVLAQIAAVCPIVTVCMKLLCMQHPLDHLGHTKLQMAHHMIPEAVMFETFKAGCPIKEGFPFSRVAMAPSCLVEPLIHTCSAMNPQMSLWSPSRLLPRHVAFDLNSTDHHALRVQCWNELILEDILLNLHQANERMVCQTAQ